MKLKSVLFTICIALFYLIGTIPIPVHSYAPDSNDNSIYFITDESLLPSQYGLKLWRYSLDTKTLTYISDRTFSQKEPLGNMMPQSEWEAGLKYYYSTEADLEKAKNYGAEHRIDSIYRVPGSDQLLVLESVGICLDHDRLCYGVIRLWTFEIGDNFEPKQMLMQVPVHSEIFDNCYPDMFDYSFEGIQWSPDGRYFLLSANCYFNPSVKSYVAFRLEDQKLYKIGVNLHTIWASANNEIAIVTNKMCTDNEKPSSECGLDFAIFDLENLITPITTVRFENFFTGIHDGFHYSPYHNSLIIVGQNIFTRQLELRVYDPLQQDNYTVLFPDLSGIRSSWSTAPETLIGVVSLRNPDRISIYDANLANMVNYDVPIRRLKWATNANILWGYCSDCSDFIFLDPLNKTIQRVNLYRLLDETAQVTHVAIIAVTF